MTLDGPRPPPASGMVRPQESLRSPARWVAQTEVVNAARAPMAMTRQGMTVRRMDPSRAMGLTRRRGADSR